MSNAFPSPILMILLSEPFSITAEALQAYLREKLNPELTVTGDSNNKDSFIITWNNMAFAVMCVDQPIPTETFNTALILTLGVMTIADLIAIQAGPEGFYWSNSEVLVENDQFASYTGQAGEALGKFNQKVPNALYGLPSTLWAGLRFFSPDQKTQFGAITKGLDALTGFEIQIDPYINTQAEVAKHLMGMVAYILANGPVFVDGNTIGIEQDKNFKMNLVPAKAGMPARWVMKLVVPH